MKTEYVIGGIMLMALVSYLPRVIPLLLFNAQLKSKRIQTFLKYMPFAVLGAMTFPSIFTSTGHWVIGTMGCIVALVLAYFECSLLTVTLVTVASVWFFGFFI